MEAPYYHGEADGSGNWAFAVPEGRRIRIHAITATYDNVTDGSVGFYFEVSTDGKYVAGGTTGALYGCQSAGGRVFAMLGGVPTPMAATEQNMSTGVFTYHGIDGVMTLNLPDIWLAGNVKVNVYSGAGTLTNVVVYYEQRPS
jgi:hypothetical protein